eukprot:TRINITY_DN8631_c0_g1_i5.p1 TRINITY_DN8631_c0_g1~~TRINITY_DN8631_c0_g1_i5.p1  ORF type:complete len:330 (-),score=56.49 TRINITY_DN8631_c0_g1_i5:149-1138(-)
MNTAARSVTLPNTMMAGRPQQAGSPQSMQSVSAFPQVKFAGQSPTNQTTGMRPRRISMPQASGMQVVQPPVGAQRMASAAKGPLVPQLAVPQLAVPSGSGSTPNVMHAPRGYVPRSFVAAAPRTALQAPSQFPVQAQAQFAPVFAPAVQTNMPAEMKFAPKREAFSQLQGSAQGSFETVETAATEKEIVADTAQAGVWFAPPVTTVQGLSATTEPEFAAPPTTTQALSDNLYNTFVAPLTHKEDQTTANSPVAETVAVDEIVKTLDAGTAKTATHEIDAASLPVQRLKQKPVGCFDVKLEKDRSLSPLLFLPPSLRRRSRSRSRGMARS